MSFTSDTLVFPVELPGSKTLPPEPFLVELAIYLQKVHLFYFVVDLKLDRPRLGAALRLALSSL